MPSLGEFDDLPNPVEPAWKVCSIPGIASFKSGIWNGIAHGPEFVNTLKANFDKYSSGPNPYYVPYVSINHKDELQAGKVSGASVSGDTLVLDADDVPEPVGAWRNAGGLRQPSIEYFEPKYDANGNLIDGFRRPDGSIEPTPVLKCLTLLGADAPAVKGLPDLPFARFSHAPRLDRSNPGKGAHVRRFANSGGSMDRAALIAALQAAGIDVSSVTDAVPDAFLQSILDAWQAKAANPTPTPDAPAFADTGAGAAAGLVMPPMPGAAAGGPEPAPAGAPVQLPAGQTQPQSITLKFADNTPAAIQAGWQEAMNQIERQNAAYLDRLKAEHEKKFGALNRQQTQQAYAAKFRDVSAFVVSLATPDAQGMVRITYAQRQGMVNALMKMDGESVRKFSDGSGKRGTELDEAKAYHLATLPKLKAVGEKVPDGRGGNAVGAGASGTTLSPELRNKFLSSTDLGKKTLERLAAKK